jgi:hypothetical protein
MGSVVGTDGHTASGYVGAAIVGSSITLSFKDVIIEGGAIATADPLEVFLTINGNMAKRPIALGSLPAGEGSFDLAVPDGTDISLFNTLIIQPVGAETAIAKASIP